jgi:hypothetical protein
MNIGSGALASFLRKNLTFRHPTGGSNIEKWKYGLIPDPERTKISTLPHTAASASEPSCSRVWKK